MKIEKLNFDIKIAFDTLKLKGNILKYLRTTLNLTKYNLKC